MVISVKITYSKIAFLLLLKNNDKNIGWQLKWYSFYFILRKSVNEDNSYNTFMSYLNNHNIFLAEVKICQNAKDI